MNKLKLLILSVVLFSLLDHSLASIPERDREINFSTIQPVYSLNKDWFNKDIFTKYCPSTLTPTTDQKALSSQFQMGVAQKFADSVVNDTLMQQPMLKTIKHQVDTATSQALTIGSLSPSGISHKIVFKVNTAERQAVATYDGYFHSDATYRMATNDVVISVSKPLNSVTTMAIQNVMPIDQSSNSTNLTLTYQF